MKEIILLLALALSLFLIFLSLRRLTNLYEAGRISSGARNRMTYLVLIVPLLGFLLTYGAFTRSPGCSDL